ncbi:unnamed protein product, partial [methanotrophic bacterial endosymbiont of Bathymodiolus sp.]
FGGLDSYPANHGERTRGNYLKNHLDLRQNPYSYQEKAGSQFTKRRFVAFIMRYYPELRLVLLANVLINSDAL